MRDKHKPPVRPVVFICSPYAGDTKNNVARAKLYCRFAYISGAIPFAPHLLYPQFMDDSVETEREHALKFGIFWLGKCDELWYFGNRISAGMEKEIEFARRGGKKVRHFGEDYEEIFDEPEEKQEWKPRQKKVHL